MDNLEDRWHVQVGLTVADGRSNGHKAKCNPPLGASVWGPWDHPIGLVSVENGGLALENFLSLLAALCSSRALLEPSYRPEWVKGGPDHPQEVPRPLRWFVGTPKV